MNRMIGRVAPLRPHPKSNCDLVCSRHNLNVWISLGSNRLFCCNCGSVEQETLPVRWGSERLVWRTTASPIHTATVTLVQCKPDHQLNVHAMLRLLKFDRMLQIRAKHFAPLHLYTGEHLIQKLIRRWESKRQLFTTISHLGYFKILKKENRLRLTN